MGKEIVYCSVCGERISSSDCEKGKAVVILKRYFCKKCAVTVVKESSEGPTHNPTVTPEPIKIRTQRIPPADRPQTRGALIPYLIAGGIGVVVLILLLYVLLFKKG